MKEVQFIKENQERWQAFEDEDYVSDPDLLSERFVQLTDDLSYARTFFPDYPVMRYLNTLTASFYQKIYRNKKEDGNRFLNFWAYELPTLFWQSHRELGYSFLIFAISTLIGAVSTAYDETFVRVILGDEYVNMTLENIANGDPMGVYKGGGMLESFLVITINNVRVSFLTFIGLGILFGIPFPLFSIGSATMLFRNGVMLGAFQYFFYQHGVLTESLLVIWIHGTLEISAIVIAGCAGLVMGNSVIFPGTYSRVESFKKGAKQGLKIAIGLVPVFITAGFLEGFVTRQPLHPVASCLIIGFSALFIIGYFVVYPRWLNRGIG